MKKKTTSPAFTWGKGPTSTGNTAPSLHGKTNTYIFTPLYTYIFTARPLFCSSSGSQKGTEKPCSPGELLWGNISLPQKLVLFAVTAHCQSLPLVFDGVEFPLLFHEYASIKTQNPFLQPHEGKRCHGICQSATLVLVQAQYQEAFLYRSPEN